MGLLGQTEILRREAIISNIRKDTQQAAEELRRAPFTHQKLRDELPMREGAGGDQ